MTTAMPEGNSSEDEPSGARMDEEEIARRFSEIVSTMSQTMDWGETGDLESDRESSQPVADRHQQRSNRRDDLEEPDTAERRRLRREQRTANRSAEAEAFAADRARREAEYAQDDQHFVPGEPPPLTMPKMRTILAVLLIASGVFLLFGPNLLTLSPDGSVIVSIILVIIGGALLITGLRRNPGSTDPGEGWDDGSRV